MEGGKKESDQPKSKPEEKSSSTKSGARPGAAPKTKKAQSTWIASKKEGEGEEKPKSPEPTAAKTSKPKADSSKKPGEKKSSQKKSSLKKDTPSTGSQDEKKRSSSRGKPAPSGANNNNNNNKGKKTDSKAAGGKKAAPASAGPKRGGKKEEEDDDEDKSESEEEYQRYHKSSLDMVDPASGYEFPQSENLVRNTSRQAYTREFLLSMNSSRDIPPGLQDHLQKLNVYFFGRRKSLGATERQASQARRKSTPAVVETLRSENRKMDFLSKKLDSFDSAGGEDDDKLDTSELGSLLAKGSVSVSELEKFLESRKVDRRHSLPATKLRSQLSEAREGGEREKESKDDIKASASAAEGGAEEEGAKDAKEEEAHDPLPPIQSLEPFPLEEHAVPGDLKDLVHKAKHQYLALYQDLMQLRQAASQELKLQREEAGKAKEALNSQITTLTEQLAQAVENNTDLTARVDIVSRKNSKLQNRLSLIGEKNLAITHELEMLKQGLPPSAMPGPTASSAHHGVDSDNDDDEDGGKLDKSHEHAVMSAIASSNTSPVPTQTNQPSAGVVNNVNNLSNLSPDLQSLLQFQAMPQHPAILPQHPQQQQQQQFQQLPQFYFPGNSLGLPQQNMSPMMGAMGMQNMGMNMMGQLMGQQGGAPGMGGPGGMGMGGPGGPGGGPNSPGGNPNFYGVPFVLPPNSDMVTLAKTFYGSRYIQNQIELDMLQEPSPAGGEAKRFFNTFFDQVKDRVYEVMTNKFGRFAFEKMLSRCDDDQRLAILKNLLPTLPAVASDTHGSFGTQVLIKALHTPAQLDLVVAALHKDILTLITDYKGHYLVIVLISQFPYEKFKFIDDAILGNCVMVSTNNQGLQVMKAMFKYRSTPQLLPLLNAIADNTMELVENQYGNYVVQQALAKTDNEGENMQDREGEMGYMVNQITTNPGDDDPQLQDVRERILHKMQGHFRRLSQQKFSSNVVELCLKSAYFAHWAHVVISELLAPPPNAVRALMNDRFGNYVLQTALAVAGEQQVAFITDRIVPHLPTFRTNLRNKWTKLVKNARDRVNLSGNDYHMGGGGDVMGGFSKLSMDSSMHLGGNLHLDDQH